MLSFLLLLLQIDFYTLSNSSTIFNMAIQYIKEGKMKVPKDMNYFIFDESNVTALDINGNKMNDLYNKQKEIFDKHSIANYIFIVDSQDESTEGLTNTTHNLAEYLRNRYNINKDYAIILLISLSPGKIKIRTGDTIKRKITDSISNTMISNIRPYLKNKKYYEAWNQFISDINNNLYEYPEYREKEKSNKGEKALEIISGIIGPLIVISCIIIYCICKTKKFKVQFQRVAISTFLRANKNNNEIFKEYCVICLQPLNNNQIQITTQNDFNNTQTQNQINVNNLTTLKCGHQYHNKCFMKYNKNDCPICLKQNDPILKVNNERTIWAIQQDLIPKLGPYIDNTYIRKNEIDDKSDGGYSYSAPSYGGGSAGRGSIGGGSVGGGSVGGASYGSGGAQGSF